MALPTIRGAPARRVIDELADANPIHGHHIRTVGIRLLELASVGMRDGRRGSTYDLSFVGERGAFACITVNVGKWNRTSEGALRLEARFEGTPPDLRLFQPKARREAERGWHYAELEPEPEPEGSADQALLELKRARR